MTSGGTPRRIGIAGIAIESSTFSPHRTGLGDFRVTRGDDLLARYSWIAARPPWAAGAEWVPLLHAAALPGGAVLAGAYRQLRAEILERAASAGPLDGLLLDIHGAMTVEGLADAEADLVRGLRGVLGGEVLMSASMDLHGNVSAELASLVDLITCYRMAPHEDAWETRERAARNLVARLRAGGKPALAWVPVPVLLPGEKTSTRIEPASSIYARVRDVAAADGVLDAAIWVGYAWADEPRCRAAVVVTGDDGDVISAHARTLARAYWEARAAFCFVAPTGDIGECVGRAIASEQRPFFVSDSGDNPTAGGAGDVAYALRHLLTEDAITGGPVQAILASIADPAAVAAAFRAGPGRPVTVQAGGKIDSGPSGPVTLTGRVHALRRDDPVGGDLAVIAAGGLQVILTSRRKPYHTIGDFTGSGVDPLAADIVVVKAGYLEPELYAAAAGWLLALTPGGVDQDLLRLGYRHLARPLFPFDPDMPAPDFTPRLLPERPAGPAPLMRYEVCVESAAGVRAAATAGADRVELCASLAVGGLTPSIAVTRDAITAAASRLAVHVLIRPRDGDFVYRAAELTAMVRDIRAARRAGAAGLVIGALTGGGAVDRAACAELIAAARPAAVTFHRAFDVAADPLGALEEVAALGADRLLTSGAAPTALAGADLIAELVRRSGGELSIMAGGGVTASTAATIVARTGVPELHFSARSPTGCGSLASRIAAIMRAAGP